MQVKLYVVYWCDVNTKIVFLIMLVFFTWEFILHFPYHSELVSSSDAPVCFLAPPVPSCCLSYLVNIVI